MSPSRTQSRSAEAVRRSEWARSIADARREYNTLLESSPIHRGPLAGVRGGVEVATPSSLVAACESLLAALKLTPIVREAQGDTGMPVEETISALSSPGYYSEVVGGCDVHIAEVLRELLVAVHAAAGRMRELAGLANALDTLQQEASDWNGRYIFAAATDAIDAEREWFQAAERERALQELFWRELASQSVGLCGAWDRVGQVCTFVLFNVRAFDGDTWTRVFDQIKKNLGQPEMPIAKHPSWVPLKKYCDGQGKGSFEWLRSRRNALTHSLSLGEEVRWGGDVTGSVIAKRRAEKIDPQPMHDEVVLLSQHTQELIRGAEEALRLCCFAVNDLGMRPPRFPV